MSVFLFGLNSSLDSFRLHSVLAVLIMFSFKCHAVDSTSKWTDKCPTQCVCEFDQMSKKAVICFNVYLDRIPTREMDTKVQVLKIVATQKSPVNITLGRIFLRFTNLETVVLRECNIPAIGDSSFWPGHNMKILDLRGNNITTIREQNFNGLTNLTDLDLSYNRISDPPSAPFKHLESLERLSLGNNQLTKLVPRMFFHLRRLESLNLSGNPLLEIHPDDIKDVTQLKQLYLADCRLARIHSLIFARLTPLEVLDLTNNRFESLFQYEFKWLRKLKVLKLSGNKLKTLQDNTFNGLDLTRLSLDGNALMSMALCSFCNSSVRILNLSSNFFTNIDAGVLSPLSDSLQILNLSNNTHLSHGSSAIENAVKPLRRLVRLHLAATNADDRLSYETFLNSADSLKLVDLSSNRFINFSHFIVSNLKSLQVLDLSNNMIQGISVDLIETFKTFTDLKYLDLEGPNWLCYRCYIAPLKDWLSTFPFAYENACQKGTGRCVRCVAPSDLYQVHVRDLNEFNMEWCPNPTIRLRLKTSEPKVGLALALIIIITLIVVIIVVVIMYRQSGDSYYTHEDDRLDEKTIFTIQRTAAATALSPPCTSSRSSCNSLSHPTVSEGDEDQSTSLPPLPAMPAPPPPPPPPPPPLPPQLPVSSQCETKPKMRY